MRLRLTAPTLFVCGFALLFLCLAAGNLIERSLQPPLADDGVEWTDTPLGVTAGNIRRGSPAERAGILRGDTLRSVDFDGHPTEIIHVWQIQYVLDEQVGIGGNITYTIERFNSLGVSKGLWDADLRDITTQPSRFNIDLYLCCVGLIYLFIGLYVFFRNEQNTQTIHFFSICLLSFTYLFFSFSGSFTAFDKLIYWMDNAALITLCPLFLHFCLRFPHPSVPDTRHRAALRLAYLPAILLVTVETAHLILGDRLSALLAVTPWLDRLRALHFALYFIASAGVVAITFSQTQSPVLRQQIKWIVWGLTLGILPWIVFYAYPRYIADLEPTPLMEGLAIGPTVLIPLSFGYSIIRYRLMDVDVIVRRSMTYALATLSVIVIFMFGVVKSTEWVGRLLPAISGSALTLLQVTIMSLGAILYNPLKNWLQERIDRLFYGARYDYRQGIADFGRTLAATTALPELLNAVVARLSEMLSVQEITVYVADLATGPRALSRPPERFTLAFARGTTPPSTLEAQIQDRLQALLGSPRSYLVDSADSAAAGSSSHFFPCVARDRIVAVIGLGRTHNHTLLTSEDVDLLRGLTPYVAVAIENSLLYQSELSRARELARLKEFNENIIESINVGLLTVDLTGRVTNCNSALEELFAVSRDESDGRRLEEVLDRDLVRTIRDLIGGTGWVLADVRTIYRYRTLARDGRPLVLNISLSPLESKEDAVTGALICFEDITSRVRLEEQLRENDKLSSIGLLAAGVAHEVNTPLTGISSYTQMLLAQIPASDTKRTILEKIQRQTLRASDIVNNLLNFSRTGNAKFTNLAIAGLLDDTLQLLEPQLRNTNIEVVRDYAQGLPPIAGQAAKLQQVFMNLILNARDAMPEGGRLTISACVEDEALVVGFADSGEGIAPEHITRIYDPFFTTKEVGRGTGLGLAVSYGIVQEHAGRIFVESEKGRGTCFRVKLPCATTEMLSAAGD